jgi:hypothetical protein
MNLCLRTCVALGLLVLAGCPDESTNMCAVPEGPATTPTCADVCAHFFEMECQLGATVEDCQRICDATEAVVDFPEAMRCYQAAKNCDDIGACSRGCGPDASAVPFAPVTIGSDAADDQDGGSL